MRQGGVKEEEETIEEKSRFVLEDGRWLYADGEVKGKSHARESAKQAAASLGLKTDQE